MKVDVESLICFGARPCSGESDDEIVISAWDFELINRGYADELEVLRLRPEGALCDQTSARAFREWASREARSPPAGVSASAGIS
jgi:hypothetical protein